MSRVFNFSAGPSVFPEPVLEKAAAEMLDYRGQGMSVLEMSHRSKMFTDILADTKARLRRLMAIPEDYHILFLQGGAFTQFAMVPINLMRRHRRGAYINTGSWSKKAMAEAKKIGAVSEIASSADSNFNYLPDLPDALPEPADYVHITTNNTIYGTAFSNMPAYGDTPLVGDMSSNILSQVYDVTQFGLIYAGAQKNAGPSGLTMVIIHKDLVGHAPENTPVMLDYQVHVKADSCHNTPPCYAIYLAGLVFEWLEDQGGVPAIETRNRKKAALLYDLLDSSSFFRATVAKPHRGLMNIPFLLADEALNKPFLTKAAEAGLVNLKGHRSVGGMRASIYNAMPLAGVQALVDFMKEFERTYG
ncbi:3-phosphoserine/phosphohydroxythreonine transaminase [Acanthopleuribacter pedis]|uniref:Phosphoserine aminotransferase n=1 Tax=Acanthopleuribacter pedis TaxID=442870 RepID=A0A8J7Q461_9BACT|nr:3-phosphoserine/phosphohydroxythreonine transaminase [Acanthopleuribacter pedis]MBO1320242.1 3-phosphoserine/phosphohydroxythreonine transaminase [Acanthopleuribacter pedis]